MRTARQSAVPSVGSLHGLARRGVKAVASAVPAPSGTVVLIYHRVGDTGGEMALPEATFDRQLSDIAATGRVATLDDAVASMTGPRSRATEHVVVTFDDGTADIVDLALPRLVAHHVPMTLYVATKFVEEQLPFPGDGRPLSWAGLRECLSTGLVTIGSHTHSHRLLDRAPAEEAADELDRSIGLIEDHLGRTPEHFAYPKALLGNAAAERAVRARFTSAAIAGTRSNPHGRVDVHRLHRSPIQRSDGHRHFLAKLHGRMRLEDDLRRAANRLRYRGRID